MDDNSPLWTVHVSFPLGLLALKEGLYAEVETLASSRGGRVDMLSQPTLEMAGKPDYQDFGCSVSFEQGDVNTESFVQLVLGRMSAMSPVVVFDPEDVIYPHDDEAVTGMGML